MAKGLSGVVDDDKLMIDGVQYDAVICVEDTKMYAGMSVSRARKSIHEIDVSDGYHGMTMYCGLVVATCATMP